MKIPFLKPKAEPQRKELEVDELVIGKVFSVELFKKYMAELGYNFEVFVDKDNKIYRFTRFANAQWNKDGDAW
jgi:hypothetical protein